MTRKKILIVEDHADTREGLAIRLRQSGYEILFSTDGLDAVSHTLRDQPDLILLDLGLPVADGTNVLDLLKTLRSTAYVPVIVLTAWAAAQWKERLLEAGAEAFFQKPADHEQLLSAIAAALAKSDAQNKTGEEYHG